MRFIDTTKLDRKSGASRGTCSSLSPPTKSKATRRFPLSANSELASQVVESEAFSSDRKLRVVLDHGADPKTGKSS